MPHLKLAVQACNSWYGWGYTGIAREIGLTILNVQLATQQQLAPLHYAHCSVYVFGPPCKLAMR